MVVEIWNHYKNRKDGSPEQCTQKGRLDQTNTNLVSIVWATLGGYSWSLTATAARLSPRTNTWHIYSASLTCKTIPCSAGLNIFYATYRLAGSYCCSLHKNLASECDEVLGSAALEEAYAGQVEPALKIILDLEIQSSLQSSLLDMSRWGAVFTMLKTLTFKREASDSPLYKMLMEKSFISAES